MPAFAAQVIQRLEAQGYSTFLVGGCVRDALLGLVAKDYDLATTALPSQIEALFSCSIIRANPAYGVYCIAACAQHVQLATLRTENGHLSHRYPAEIHFVRDVYTDLRRRDFTCNAMAYHLSDGLFDPFHGQQHLQERILCCIGNPNARFTEDALRMLRALRFSCTLGLSLTKEIRCALHLCAVYAQNLHPFCVARELFLLVSGVNLGFVFREYAALFCACVPMLRLCRCIHDERKQDFGVWMHTVGVFVECMETVNDDKTIAFLCAMLRPELFFSAKAAKPDENFSKKMHDVFYAFCVKASLGSRKIRQIDMLAHCLDCLITPDQTLVLSLLSKLTAHPFFLLLRLKRAAAKAGIGGWSLKEEAYRSIHRLAAQCLDEKVCLHVRDLRINGNDLLSMGFPPGKTIGNTLQALLEMVWQGTVPNEKEALRRACLINKSVILPKK